MTAQTSAKWAYTSGPSKAHRSRHNAAAACACRAAGTAAACTPGPQQPCRGRRLAQRLPHVLHWPPPLHAVNDAFFVHHTRGCCAQARICRPAGHMRWILWLHAWPSWLILQEAVLQEGLLCTASASSRASSTCLCSFTLGFIVLCACSCVGKIGVHCRLKDACCCLLSCGAWPVIAHAAGVSHMQPLT